MTKLDIFHKRRWRILVVGFALFLGGCGGLPDPPAATPTDEDGNPIDPSKPKPAPVKPAAKPMAKANSTPKKSAVQTPVASHSATGSLDAPEAPEEKKPVLPTELSEWTENDFRLAQSQGDPRLIPAVALRASAVRGTDEEAETLTSLLNAAALNKPAYANSGAKTALTQAVTLALLSSKSEVAKKSLVRIIQGQAATIDKNASAFAVALLLKNDSPDDDETLLSALLGAFVTQRVADDENSVRIVVPQTGILEIVRKGASTRFRKRIASTVLDSETRSPAMIQALAMLCELRPENVETQIDIYQNKNADSKTRALLEKQFAAICRDAMQSRFSRMAQASAKGAFSTEALPQAAERLWSESFTGFLDLQFKDLAKLSSRPTAALLAASIPSPSMRVDLRQILSRHWSEGPGAFRFDAASDGLIVEPGFLLTLKGAVRENQSKTLTAKPVKLTKAAKNPDADVEDRPTPVSGADWNKFVEDVVMNLNRCGYRGAMDRITDAYRAGERVEEEIESNELPFKPHPQGKTVAVHRFDWPPEESEGKTSSGETLRLRYVRIEQKAKPDRLLSYYRRLVKSAVERPTAGGLWFDGFFDLKKEGRSQSIDVIVSRANAGAFVMNEDQELTVEILVVETLNARK